MEKGILYYHVIIISLSGIATLLPGGQQRREIPAGPGQTMVTP